ncbi:MAG: hypothetical protein ACKVWV_18625 [Planctomycetota bacterium]
MIDIRPVPTSSADLLRGVRFRSRIRASAARARLDDAHNRPYNPRPMPAVKDFQDRVATLQRRYEQIKESL